AITNRLGDSGPDAAGTAPSLIQIIERPELHSNNNGFIIGGAAATLGRIGPGADAALPTLNNLAVDQSVRVGWRYTALMAIALITREQPSEREFHLQMLKSTDAQLRSTALSSFVDYDIARDGAPAIPALLDVMGENDRSFADRAQYALRVMLNYDNRARRTLERIARS